MTERIELPHGSGVGRALHFEAEDDDHWAVVWADPSDAYQYAYNVRAEFHNADRAMSVKVLPRKLRADHLAMEVFVVAVRPRGTHV